MSSSSSSPSTAAQENTKPNTKSSFQFRVDVEEFVPSFTPSAAGPAAAAASYSSNSYHYNSGYHYNNKRASGRYSEYYPGGYSNNYNYSSTFYPNSAEYYPRTQPKSIPIISPQAAPFVPEEAKHHEDGRDLPQQREECAGVDDVADNVVVQEIDDKLQEQSEQTEIKPDVLDAIAEEEAIAEAESLAEEEEVQLPIADEEASLPVAEEEAVLPIADEEASLPVAEEEAVLPIAVEEAALPEAQCCEESATSLEVEQLEAHLEQKVDSCKYSIEFMLEFKFMDDMLESMDLTLPCLAKRKSSGAIPISRGRISRQFGSSSRVSRQGQGKKSISSVSSSVLDGSWRQDYVELKPSENGFKITHAEGVEKILREVKALLNKLTLENFISLLDKLATLILSNIELVEDICRLLYEKGVTEPHFAVVYADFSRQLKDHLSQCADSSAKGIEAQFRAALLRCCQHEFESSSSDHEEKLAGLSTEEEKEEFLNKCRKREFGVVSFVGALFKHDFMKASVIKHCLLWCIKSKSVGFPDARKDHPSEDDVESVCKLLTSVGAKLDKSEAAYVKDVFNILLKMCSNSALYSARIRFMIKDLIELKNDGWVPRRKQDEIRKVSDLRKEASVVLKAGPPAGASKKKSSKKESKDRFGSDFKPVQARKIRNSENSSTGNDQWTVAGKRGGFSNVRHRSPVKDDGESEPVGEKKTFGGFHALADDGDAQEDDVSQKSNAGDSDGEDVVSSSSSVLHEDAKDQEGASVLSEDQLVKIRRSVRSMLEEFCQLKSNFSAAMVEVEYSLPQIGKHTFLIVPECLSMVVDQKNADCKAFIQMLLNLSESRHLSESDVQLGLDEFVKGLEDLVIDIPRAPEVLANFTAELVISGLVKLDYFSRHVWAQFCSDDLCCKVFAKTVKLVSASIGVPAATEKITSNLINSLQQKRPSGDISHFLAQQEVEFVSLLL
eukprot:TRINITY_DN780_c0_g1_i5.p1 TRINITY_DN780_c0_g1~~TRINITY_DN780_c0_g1_i5.p1  ORF type:complete len:953 (+),score=291.18 TRINITY_DN780_c0_g1_i5:293-3151(+)